MFKKIKQVLKKNKDISLLHSELKTIKGNKNYLNYVLDFNKHHLDPKEDIEERTYDVLNYLRNSKEIIINLGKKKIKNGSVVLSDNSSIVNQILNKAKLNGKKFEVYNINFNLIEKADLILVGKNINSKIFKIAEKYNVSIFLCANSLKLTKINNNFTGIISELGIHSPDLFRAI